MAAVSRYLNWPGLVLASGSPRRRELLSAVGADFTVIKPDVGEEIVAGEGPMQAARRLARDKAAWVHARHHGDRKHQLILAADTLVVYRHHVLGKPRDGRDAARMLRLLSNNWHTVVTGVCLLDRASGRAVTAAECTRVKFRRLSPPLIARYVASGEPLDKAGAYGIQRLGALLVERVDGCYFNVVGLPLVRVAKLLERRAGRR
ncbi:MAG TPA: Maf family protein [Candidatus Edwardsbacteria bacterium]|nr:Maf family protein [Candidatus Edwardsbacteria bacterium]